MRQSADIQRAVEQSAAEGARPASFSFSKMFLRATISCAVLLDAARPSKITWNLEHCDARNQSAHTCDLIQVIKCDEQFGHDGATHLELRVADLR